jgi:hypothetical protein
MRRGGAGGTNRGIRLSCLYEELKHQFTYHAPSEPQIESMKRIREKGLELAKVIADETPPSVDQRDAIRRVREAVMFANASIVLEKKR